MRSDPKASPAYGLMFFAAVLFAVLSIPPEKVTKTADDIEPDADAEASKATSNNRTPLRALLASVGKPISTTYASVSIRLQEGIALARTEQQSQPLAVLASNAPATSISGVGPAATALPAIIPTTVGLTSVGLGGGFLEENPFLTPPSQQTSDSIAEILLSEHSPLNTPDIPSVLGGEISFTFTPTPTILATPRIIDPLDATPLATEETTHYSRAELQDALDAVLQSRHADAPSVESLRPILESILNEATDASEAVENGLDSARRNAFRGLSSACPMTGTSIVSQRTRAGFIAAGDMIEFVVRSRYHANVRPINQRLSMWAVSGLAISARTSPSIIETCNDPLELMYDRIVAQLSRPILADFGPMDAPGSTFAAAPTQTPTETTTRFANSQPPISSPRRVSSPEEITEEVITETILPLHTQALE